MTLTDSDKVMIAAAGAITLGAIIVSHQAKKYAEKNDEICDTLDEVYYLSSAIKSSIDKGNEEIANGNALLRKAITNEISNSHYSKDGVRK